MSFESAKVLLPLPPSRSQPCCAGQGPSTSHFRFSMHGDSFPQPASGPCLGIVPSLEQKSDIMNSIHEVEERKNLRQGAGRDCVYDVCILDD